MAGLLAWLDARSRGAPILLRLEDVDSTRCTPESAEDMRAALAWFGLDWDREELQSANRPTHEAALDALAAQGRLYPCTCSRSEVASAGVRAPDGGWRYTGRCREKPLPAGGWRGRRRRAARAEPEGWFEVRDESGLHLSQNVAIEMGDPVLRRRDGAIAYHLAVVVDDARAGISRIVRGRDLATSTATHVALQRAARPAHARVSPPLPAARRGGRKARKAARVDRLAQARAQPFESRALRPARAARGLARRRARDLAARARHGLRLEARAHGRLQVHSVKLLRRRPVWQPTAWGWLVVFVACAALATLAVRNVCTVFLAPNQPVGGRILVVEGWMPAAELDQVLALYRAGGYERVVTNGGPIENGVDRATSGSYADVSRDYLIRHGLASDAVVAVPAPDTAQYRSYLNAVMVREWVERSGVTVDALDVLSLRVHSRRSWLLHSRAFGPRVRVGIISAPASLYDPQHWWRTSVGAKEVITESIAWLWTELFFDPGPPGSPEEKQEIE